MPLASLELRNKQSLATSLAVGNLPSAVCEAAKFSRNSLVSSPLGDCSFLSAVKSPGVSIRTGQTALTLIPCTPNSLHKLCVKAVTPNFVAD